MNTASPHDYSEFTEIGYRTLLEKAQARYSFEAFGTTTDQPHVLWRHDVDMSVHRALRLARIEAEAGVRATYFLLPHSRFYNLLETTVFALAADIVRCGHRIGLHFDPAFHAARPGGADLEACLRWERRLLTDLLEVPVDVFSFHNPTAELISKHSADTIAGMINTYGKYTRERYTYCSDSNGYWRHERLSDVLDDSPPRLHVLTHPEWWVEEPLSPRDRVDRCITGRARKVAAEYDRSMQAAGRKNVGKADDDRER